MARRETREEQAAREVGVTDVQPAVARALMWVFLVLIFVVPAAQLCVEWRQGDLASLEGLSLWDPEGRLDRVREAETGEARRREWRRVNAGLQEDMGAVETALEESWMLREPVIDGMRGLFSGVLGVGTEDAYIGRNGWLFYRPGIDHLTGHPFLSEQRLARIARSGSEFQAPRSADPVEALLDFARQLKARDIQLVVVPAPGKAQIYPEHFSGRYDAADAGLHNPSFDLFVQRLEEGGVHVFDLARPFAEMRKTTPEAELYLRTDTHWTPFGMRLAATLLASDILERHPELKRGDFKPDVVSEPITYQGDVASMLVGASGLDERYLEQVRIERPGDSARQRESAVLVLGDSFSNIYSDPVMGWGEGARFVEHLALALERPVDAITINDNGAHAARVALEREMQKGVDRLHGKRLVVLEFASRELSVGDWKAVDLTLGEAQAAGATEAVSVEGTVAQVLPTPTPGTVPYTECLVGIHLEGVHALGDPDAGMSDCVVYSWGMRSNTLVEAAFYKAGDRVQLALTPWSDPGVQKRFGGIQRRADLDDPDLLLIDLQDYLGEAMVSEDAMDAALTFGFRERAAGAVAGVIVLLFIIKGISRIRRLGVAGEVGS